MRKILILLCSVCICLASCAQPNSEQESSAIQPGAYSLGEYLPLMQGKNIALFANQTSMVGDVHLADILKKNGVKISVIFGPEHGFRGTASAGEKVSSYIDEETGVKVISLYGSKRRPSAQDLDSVDVMVFDIQDVGVRFYTYISSLEEYIESAIENDLPLIILDRPNPNGFYVDGPVLEKEFTSFVGMQPIPIVYGMTIGEYAKMLIGEKWLNEKTNKLLDQKSSSDRKFSLTVIKNKNYDHTSKYVLPVKPSPNLPDIQSIYWYPSTCLFEGTTLSEGRGTDKPFQIFGAPSLPDTLFSFTPAPREGATSSKHYNEVCYGWDISGSPEKVLEEVNNRLQLKWILTAYKLFPDKNSFFIKPKSGNMKQSFFDKLAGNDQLWKQIVNQTSEDEIRAEWQPKLNEFKEIRKKYLLYKDFE